MSEKIDAILKINLKSQESDFVVNEVPLPQVYKDGSAYIYSLKKLGFRTDEAVEMISDYASCPVGSVGYCGLKDEDGVTVQLISLPIMFTGKQISEFNTITPGIQLIYQGSSDKELKVGTLLGNSFKVTARNINSSLAQKLSSIPSHRSMYINFYGLQRFGKPGLKKNTHVIGEHLINYRYKQALDLLNAQSEGKPSITDEPEKYFKYIDPRRLAFYLNSYYSYIWNNELQKKILRQFDKVVQFECESIPFTYIKEKLDKLKFLSNLDEQKIIKYRTKDNKPVEVHSSRQTFIYTEIFVSNMENDELNPGMKRVDLSFFLPSGSYATVILPQFFYEIS